MAGDYSAWKRYIWAISAILFMGVVALLMLAGWMPGPDFLSNPIFAGGLMFVTVLGVSAYLAQDRLTSTDTAFDSWSGPQDPLTDEEIYRLLEHRLFFHENMRIKDVASKGSELVKSQGESDEAARLYKLVFDRRNVSERVGVYVDLGQPLNVDPENLGEAASRIQNMKVIRGSLVDDFESELEDAREKLAESASQTIKITEYEDGEPVEKREMPASFRRVETEETEEG